MTGMAKKKSIFSALPSVIPQKQRRQSLPQNGWFQEDSGNQLKPIITAMLYEISAIELTLAFTLVHRFNPNKGIPQND